LSLDRSPSWHIRKRNEKRGRPQIFSILFCRRRESLLHWEGKKGKGNPFRGCHVPADDSGRESKLFVEKERNTSHLCHSYVCESGLFRAEELEKKEEGKTRSAYPPFKRKTWQTLYREEGGEKIITPMLSHSWGLSISVVGGRGGRGRGGETSLTFGGAEGRGGSRER